MKMKANREACVILLSVALAGCGNTGTSDSAPSAAPVEPASAVKAAPIAFNEYVATAQPSTGGTCALDVVNGAPPATAVLAANAEATFTGWIADATGNVPTDALLVLSGDKSYSVALAPNVERPDVATALNAPAALRSGYIVETTLVGVTPGSYDTAIVYGGTSPSRCALNANVTIAN